MSWADTIRNTFSGSSTSILEQAKTYVTQAVDEYIPKDLQKSILPATSALLAVSQIEKIYVYYEAGHKFESLKAAGTVVALSAFAIATKPTHDVATVAIGLLAVGNACRISYKMVMHTADLCRQKIKRCFEKEKNRLCTDCYQFTHREPRKRHVECKECHRYQFIFPNESGEYVLPAKEKPSVLELTN